MIDENVMIAVSNLATKIKKLVSDHAAIKGNGSTFGHVKASDSSLIKPIGDTLEVGTDNNQYARADHVHTVTYSKIKNPPYIPSKTSDLTNDSGFLTEHQDISGKVNIAQGSSKANMNVVTNASGNITTEAKPFIPSKTSDLTNDSGYLTQHQDISGKEDKTNKTSSWNSTPNNTRYPTEKLVKDSLDEKSDNGHTHSQYLTSHQDISGKENTSNKTSSWNSTTNNTRYPTEKLVKDSLDGKSDTDHTHPNATSSSNGLMSSDDKAKLDGISSGANAYTHPSYTARTGKPTGNQTPAFGGTATVSQITSDATGHVTGATDRTIKIPNTEASTTEAGLMSADDKTKLNGIEGSANNYTHPSYTAKTGKPTANQTPAFGGTATVSQITSDSTGHVTGATDRTIKIPNTLANGTTAGLSTNDYTTTEKTKLAGVATGATKNTVSNSLSDTSTTNALSAAKGADLQEQINNIVTGETATDHNHDNLYSVSLAKLDTPTSGYIATYEVTQGSTSLGKIDIPKDYLVKSGSVKSVTTANNPVSGYAVGDKYIDFVINTKDNSGTDEHIYINVKDLIDVYTHPNSGVTAGTNYNSNQTPAFGATFNIPKLTFNAQGHITASANSTVKIPNTLGNGTTAGLSTNDYTTTEKTKLSGIEEEANKYTHPTGTAKTGNPTANQTPAFGSTFKVTQFTSNSTGHISGATDRTIKIPNTLGDGTTAGLSTNDYTTTEKTKLSGIATGATKNTVENSLSSDSTTNALSAAQGKELKTAIDGKSTVSYIQTGTGTVEIGKINIDGTEIAIKQRDNNTTYTAASATPLADTISGTVGTSAKYAREDHAHPHFDFSGMKGTDNTTGYVKALQLKPTATYQDKPIAIEIFQRDRTEKTVVQIKYNNANSTDPTLQSITHTGQNINVYLYKSTTSTWELICSKGHSEKYGEMVVKIDNPNSGITITKMDTHIATLPTSNITQSTYIGFTSAEKTKLSGIATGANKTTIANNLTTTTAGSALDATQGKALKTTIDGKSTVSVSPTKTSGIEIGRITVDGTEKILYQQDNNTTYSNATTSAAGLMSKDDKSKLDGITASADAVSFSQTKTSGIEIGKITINGTATSIYQQDNNTTYSNATTSAAGLMSKDDKSKLNGITASADAVSFSRSLNSGTKIGTLTINGTGTDLYCNNDTNTTYSAATQSANGLMSSTDKKKLDGIDTGANAYTHPSTHPTTIITESNALDNLETAANATQQTINSNIDKKFGTIIPNGTTSAHNDLNKYNKPGFYYQSGNSNTTYIDNLPNDTRRAFTLLVEYQTGTYGVKQTLTFYNTSDPQTFIRIGAYNATATSGWGAWKEVAWTNDIPTKTSQLTNDSGFLTSYTPPTGSTSQEGIVKLNTSTSSTSTTEAATPSAVKSAYDLANGKPSLGTTASTAAKGNHTHGNITNAGAIGSTANKPIITTTSGKLTTGSFGTTANTFCEGDDSRLSDARTPLAHTHKGWDSKSSSSNWQLYVNSDLRLAFFRYDAGVPGGLSNNATFDILTSGATVTNSPLHGTSFTTQNPYLSAWITAEGYVQVWTSDKSKFSKLIFSGFYLTAA